MDKKIKAVILAAGMGKRLRTEGCDLPKVMRLANGKPLLHYVLQGLRFIEPKDTVIVVGYKKEYVMEAFPAYPFAEQAKQLGTGHAVMCAAGELEGYDGPVLVCCGDMPLLSEATYRSLVEAYEKENCACVLLTGTSDVDLPFGRVIRDERGEYLRIVEQKDCTEEQLKITELNAGLYVFDCRKLLACLGELKSDNAQGEYYLTDVPEIMMKKGWRVVAHKRELGTEIIGVNNVEQLQTVEGVLRENAMKNMWGDYYLELEPAQTQAYLERIGLPERRALSKEYLDELIAAHQCTVPFESTYISEYDLPIELDPYSLYEKIVLKRRGGYCFELNGAFMLLLRGLGFDAYSCPCRVRMGATDETPLSPVLHRGTVVRLDGKKYFMDVGFGGPMPMGVIDVDDPEPQTVRGQTFRSEHAGAHWYKLTRLNSEGKWENVLLFGTARWQPVDFVGPSMYCSSPKSYFGVRQASLRRPDGYVSIRGDEFTDAKGEQIVRRTVTPEEGKQILKDVFGL